LPNLHDELNLPGIPKWYDFEMKVWELGEKVRQKLEKCKPLWKDKELLDLFLPICLNENAKRGRQSFIMLFWFKHCEPYSSRIITQINDDFVTGHVIQGLNKMKASGYLEIVRPFTNHKIAWIRNQAKKFVSQFS
jgi:hypothetical protein